MEWIILACVFVPIVYLCGYAAGCEKVDDSVRKSLDDLAKCTNVLRFHGINGAWLDALEDRARHLRKRLA